MSVTYSTNFMCPISIDWYLERGLVKNDKITTSYCGGRIDIRDDSKQGYDGWDEYSVSPMHEEDWNLLSNWLWDLETTEVWDYDVLISIFEGEVLNGRKIRWWNDEG
jgi:hypothetical protein